jgi:ApbE superfamily uncharacterized protein (UPF0280 family)
MSYEYYIGVMDDESVLAECGPMRLVIRAWHSDQPRLELAGQAAHASISFLERIARWRLLLSRPWRQIGDLPEDELAQRMIASVQTIGDDDLTPMAAVAGTIADAVADWLFERDTTRVIVDNGGDIAIRLARGETAAVGIRPRIDSPEVSHVIHLDSSYSTWGVTTSGMGGRSLTRGIASAATVLAADASVADAAATAVANACIATDDGIIQLPAEEVDPNSELAGLKVTAGVGKLDTCMKRQAITAARRKAERLSKNDTIIGAFIARGNAFVITEGLRPYVSAMNL